MSGLRKRRNIALPPPLLSSASHLFLFLLRTLAMCIYGYKPVILLFTSTLHWPSLNHCYLYLLSSWICLVIPSSQSVLREIMMHIKLYVGCREGKWSWALKFTYCRISSGLQQNLDDPNGVIWYCYTCVGGV